MINIYRVVLGFLLKNAAVPQVVNINKFIENSIEYTRQKRITRLVDLLKKHLSGEGSEGSVFSDISSESDLIEALKSANWVQITDPEPGVYRFKTHDIKGKMGLVDLNNTIASHVYYRHVKKGDTGSESIKAFIKESDGGVGDELPCTIIAIQEGQHSHIPGGYILSFYPCSEDEKTGLPKTVFSGPKFNMLKPWQKDMLKNGGEYKVTVNEALTHGCTHAKVIA